MSRALARASLRHLARHPLLTGLSVLGIALGVAVVVSVDLASESARRAFALSSEGVSGRATHHLVAGSVGLDERIYVRLRLELGLEAAAPIVEGWVISPREPGRALRILGVDPFAEGPFRSYAGGGGGAPRAFFLEPGAALAASSTAARLGVAKGGPLPIVVDGVEKGLALVALLDGGEGAGAAALDDTLITDVATAQEILGRVGRLSRIDLITPDSSEGAALAARAAAICEGRCELVTAAARSLGTTQMARAFTLNLRALSLLALVVGMFLVYNTVTFSVVQRRPLLGTLRALGLTRRGVFALVVGEASLLALPGTALGLALGVLLASELTRLVTRTINDLYFVVNVRSLALDPATLAKGLALGLAATLASALAPAWEATRVPPVITLRRSSAETSLAGRAVKLAAAGALLIAAAAALLAAPSRGLFTAYAGLFAILFGAALVTPLATRGFARLVRPLAAWLFGVLGRMAARSMVASLSRTSVAMAALMVAMATAIGVGVMVQSFRQTVMDWLGASLQSDIFVQPPNLVSRKGEGALLPDVVERVRAVAGVRAVNTIRNRRVRAGDGEVDLHVPRYGDPRAAAYRFRARESGDVLRALQEEDAVAITEPYAFHHALGVGATLAITTDRGRRPFRVVAVYADYASDEGGVLMMRAIYERHFDDRAVSALALSAEPGVDLADLRDRVRAEAGGRQAITVRANRELREASLAIFDRTFAITQVLRLLSIGVAFVGVVSALMALALERARELAVLRAMGLTPRQLLGLVTLETSLLGACAGLFAIPLGLALAVILVFVINRRSFGWTLELVVTWPALLEALALSIAAALLAGIYPALRMARANPARALRQDG